MILAPETLLYALLGGILPAVLWLWFWLKEDSKRPEPRGLILKLFFAGITAVLLVFPIEKWVYEILNNGTIIIIVWAASEEIIKFAAVYIAGLRTVFFDEPIDAVVYFITVALGFAALENTLFIIKPLLDGETMISVLTGNLRFVGATLLHIAASGTIGVCIAFSFYKTKLIKIIFTLLGITIAITLHTLFNYFILKSEADYMFAILLSLWAAIILLILIIERVKKLRSN